MSSKAQQSNMEPQLVEMLQYFISIFKPISSVSNLGKLITELLRN